MFRRLRTLWRLADGEIEERLGGLEWVAEPYIERLNGLEARLAPLGVRLTTQNKRLDTLSARLDLLQPKRDMVTCPACEGQHYGPTTDPTCPHPSCGLCQGHGEVEEHVAVYVQQLHARIEGLGRELASRISELRLFREDLEEEVI